MAQLKMPSSDDLAELVAAPPLQIDISGPSALEILGTLQLVLRHEQFKHTGAAATARKLAQGLEVHIVQHAPGLEALCAAGWNPEHDQDLDFQRHYQ